VANECGGDWRRQARIVAAYRDCHGITSPVPLAAQAESEA
jgi:hypothetical protein